MESEETAGAPEEAPAPKRVTPIDIQQAVFRRAAFRGYSEQDVDEFLDRVTEELALLLEEQRRLREQAAMEASGAAVAEGAEAGRLADDIVRKAREEAERIVREAEMRAAAAAPDAGALGPFLSEEREFLQELAKRIGDHAKKMRDLGRETKRAAKEAAAKAKQGSGKGAGSRAEPEEGGETQSQKKDPPPSGLVEAPKRGRRAGSSRRR